MNDCGVSSNPFVGLRPFETDEAPLFFGRGDQTTELVTALHRSHFLAVVGSSGCGKSSLVRAGLIPRLKAGMLVGDRDAWFIATMKPGNSPRRNLAASLAEIMPENEGADQRGLDQVLRESGSAGVLDLLAPHLEARDANLLLLVDQFEELFRFGFEKRTMRRRMKRPTSFLRDNSTLRHTRTFLCTSSLPSDPITLADAMPSTAFPRPSTAASTLCRASTERRGARQLSAPYSFSLARLPLASSIEFLMTWETKRISSL